MKCFHSHVDRRPSCSPPPCLPGPGHAFFSLVPVYIGGTEIPASTGQYLPDSPGPQALSMHQVFGAHVMGRV